MRSLPFALAMAALIVLAGVLAVSADTAHHRASHRITAHHGLPWCGMWMEQHTGIHGPGNLALAREWAHVGHPASGPAPGVIGVMPHHVFQVIQVLGRDRHGNQIVLAISGNDGHAVRTRPRSTVGVIAWRYIA